MHIRLAGAQDKLAWDLYVDSLHDAAPYFLFAWKEAVEQAYGHKACYLVAADQGVIKGILPLFVFRIPFRGTSFISLPFCDVGGVFADNDEIKKALVDEAMALAKRSKARSVEVRSCQSNLLENGGGEYHVSVKAGKVRMLLNLPGSSEELWRSFKSKLRSQINKAEKNGLTFRWGTIKDLNAFYYVYSHNMHDLGSPVHHQEWIEKVLVQYGENARMGLVFKEDQPVGCGIILLTQYTVSIPWASTLRKYNRLSPNMMLYWNFLQYAVDIEKKVFDFGRSTPNEGTYHFKKQWGAEQEQLCWYRFNETQLKEGPPQGLSRGRLEKIWQKMPFTLANFIGPKVRKFISL